MTHTVGPWQAVLPDDPRGQPVPYYRGLVCIVSSDPAMSVVTDGRECTAEEWADNCRLLAAAPELLRAAQNLLKVNDECVAAVQRGANPSLLGERFSDTLPVLRAAISKATTPDRTDDR